MDELNHLWINHSPTQRWWIARPAEYGNRVFTMRPSALYAREEKTGGDLSKDAFIHSFIHMRSACVVLHVSNCIASTEVFPVPLLPWQQVERLILLCQEALECAMPRPTQEVGVENHQTRAEDKPATAFVLGKSRHNAKNCGSKNFSITIDYFFMTAVQKFSINFADSSWPNRVRNEISEDEPAAWDSTLRWWFRASAFSSSA